MATRVEHDLLIVPSIALKLHNHSMIIGTNLSLRPLPRKITSGLTRDSLSVKIVSCTVHCCFGTSSVVPYSFCTCPLIAIATIEGERQWCSVNVGNSRECELSKWAFASTCTLGNKMTDVYVEQANLHLQIAWLTLVVRRRKIPARSLKRSNHPAEN